MRATDQNRARRFDRQAMSRADAEIDKFARNRAVLIQQIYADPNYSECKRTGILAADPDPLTVAPTYGWNLMGYSGLHGYLHFEGVGAGESADLELWAWDGDNRRWFLVDTVTGVTRNKEFHFANKVRSRNVAVRVKSLTLGGFTHVDVICSPE